jgi:hypothetical protein
MAITTRENAIDEIIAAFDQIGLRVRDSTAGSKNDDECRNRTEHAVPHFLAAGLYIALARLQGSQIGSSASQDPTH